MNSGSVVPPMWPAGVDPDYSPEAVRSSIQSSLKRLGVDSIDILHCHDIEFCTDMRQVRCCAGARASYRVAPFMNVDQRQATSCR